MLKRLHIYLKERYPLVARLILGLIVFLEIHFIILLNEGVTEFKIGIQEVVGAFTVFAFLLWLRIADDLKARMAVIVNYEKVEAEEQRRICDFVNGACYVSDGGAKRISDYIVLYVPEGIDVSEAMSVAVLK